ncbi:MAG: sensor domain-containing diguanylate cyclase [Pseudomonadales bacterium]|nr:sensor domain-containing diguanylate cyclase [Pseudomonadales bacterium]
MTGATSGSRILLDDTSTRVDVSSSLQFYEDIGGELGFSDIYEDRLAIPWQDVPNGMPSFGYSRSAYWFLVEIDSQTDMRQWYLNINNTQIRALDLYIIEKGDIKKVYQAGDRFEFTGRPLTYRSFLFPLELEKGRQLEVLIRVQTPYSISAPLFLIEQTTLLQQSVQTELAYGLFFGFLIVMAIYNFFMFLATREFGYLFYVLFTLSSAMFISAERGFAFQYLWPSSIYWQHQAVGIFACMTMFFAGLFVVEFLRLKELQSTLYYLVMSVVVYSGVMMFFGGFIDAYYLQQCNAIVVLVASVFILTSGLLAWRRGQKEAGYFVVAWFVYIVGVSGMVFYRIGFVPAFFVTEYSIEIGAVFELSLLSFALADKLNRKRNVQMITAQQVKHTEAKILADQGFALDRERISNERLEKNVKKRTERLHQVLAELSQMNHKLEEINTIDAVTGLKNQVSFTQRLQEEWERAYRDQAPVALLLVSIERFDAIGDCYGYVAADESLKMIGQILRSLVTRPADLLARLEVEQFAAVLPNTDKGGVEHLVKKINSRLKAEPINLGVCCISVSVACGASVVVPQKSGESDWLLLDAREQLRN